MGQKIVTCLWRWTLNRGLSVCKNYIWDLDKCTWLLTTGGLLIQVAGFITGSTVYYSSPVGSGLL